MIEFCKRQSLTDGSVRFPCLRQQTDKLSLTLLPLGSSGSRTLRSLIWDNESLCVSMLGKSLRARTELTCPCRLQWIQCVPCPSWRDCLPLPVLQALPVKTASLRAFIASLQACLRSCATLSKLNAVFKSKNPSSTTSASSPPSSSSTAMLGSWICIRLIRASN